MGGKQKKHGKGRLDKYYHLAKEQGYRSRAAYKLIQLNQKYDFLSKSRVCIDLCAAPGGWLQVASKFMPMSSIIVGVDLVPIQAIKRVQTFAADITTQRCRKELQKILKTWKADVVLHDGAPNMGKAWTHDAYSQSELVLLSLKLAVEFLRPGGTFVTKVFRSADYNSLIWVFNQLFRRVEATKPSSSRAVSAEIFVVCQGYRAPTSIDPRMLDPKSVFGDIETPTQTGADIFGPEKTKKKRHRTGYDTSSALIYKEASAVDFIETDEPIEMLSQVNKITFDDPLSMIILKHPATDAEVTLCCQDLRVLGKKDFRGLLKWRSKLASWYAKLKKENGDGDGDDDGQSSEGDNSAASDDSMAQRVETRTIDLNPEEQLRSDIAELKEKMRMRQRRKKKKERAQASRYRQRLALNMVLPGDVFETPKDQNLFELEGINTRDDLDLLTDDPGHAVLAERDQGDADWYVPQWERAHKRALRRAATAAASDSEADDSTDDGLEYDRVLEEQLERNYNEYLERKKIRVQPAYRRPEDARYDAVSASVHAGAASDSDDDDDDDDNDDNDNAHANGASALEVSFGANQGSTSKAAAMWFSNPLFAGVEDDIDGELYLEEQQMLQKQQQKRRAKKRARTGDSTSTDDDSASGELAESGGGGGGGGGGRLVKRPRHMSDDSDDDDDDDDDDNDNDLDSDLDSDGRAAALASMMAPAAMSSSDFDSYEEDQREARKGRRDGTAVGKSKSGSGTAKWSDSDDGSGGADDDDFEVVPRNTDEIVADARTLLLARQIAEKRRKEALIDASYNRYAFEDVEGLPSWFQENRTPIMPETKEMMQELARMNRAINARPIKKVQEAKARRRKAEQRKLERMKRQIQSVVEDEDIDGRAKMRAIERLYRTGKSSAASARPTKQYIVARKFSTHAPGKRTGSKYKMVDKRMRSDMRAEKRSEKRASRPGRKKKRGGSKVRHKRRK